MQAAFALISNGLSALGIGGGAAAGTAAGTAVAGTAAAGAGGAAAAASTSLSLGQLLQGSATVLGMFSHIGAGEADAEALELQAIDAEREIPLENLQGINRRTAINRELQDAIGAQDTAYAASSLDLSFGTPLAARREAFREADRALTSDIGAQVTRTSRLSERAANYRRAAGRAKSRGFFEAGALGLGTAGSFLERG